MIIESSITIVDCITKLRDLGCKESVNNIIDTLSTKYSYNYDGTCVMFDPYGMLE